MFPDQVRIQCALISVHNKEGLEVLASALVQQGVKIISSGGTAQYLQKHQIPVQEISEFTGFPEMLGGRVKTLHPKIHGGILAIRNHPQHQKDLENQKILPIDLIVSNLYPFEKASQNSSLSEEKIIEEIDIGGPSLIRAGAKNFAFVAVLTHPDQYENFLEEFRSSQGNTSLAFRKCLAQKAFERTVAYDSCIVQYFQKKDSDLPDCFPLVLRKQKDLRYGENPHQRGAFYLPSSQAFETCVEALQGKPLSYNNVMDIHAAVELISEFPQGFAVGIFKHMNPCGVGISKTSLQEAYSKAFACDPVSAFGGIVVFSKPLDEKTAKECSKTFCEVLLAPDFEPAALAIFSAKKNVRIMKLPLSQFSNFQSRWEIRKSVDGYLVQEPDLSRENLETAKVVTQRSPSPKELEALTLGWKVVKHVKSNAIVISTAEEILGIGAGQMSRIDSTQIALSKSPLKNLQGSALASDAFFPFRDVLDEVASKGISCVVQPGGSIRDEEVIQAANHHHIAMIFTGFRHFRH